MRDVETQTFFSLAALTLNVRTKKLTNETESKVFARSSENGRLDKILWTILTDLTKFYISVEVLLIVQI